MAEAAREIAAAPGRRRPGLWHTPPPGARVAAKVVQSNRLLTVFSRFVITLTHSAVSSWEKTRAM